MTRYQDRFIEVIDYIEANLDRELDIERLCQLVFLSKYHFHRQCSAYFGMSVMSLVKLLKLKRAAYQLAYRNEEKILDIALENGFESHEAFSRAFKKRFNRSPSEFRRKPDWTPWHKQSEPIRMLRNKVMEHRTNFDAKVIDFPKTLLAAIEHRGSPRMLGNTIAKFIEWRKANKLPPSKSKTFNLVYDDPNTTAPEDYRFDVCCSVDKPIESNDYGAVNKIIPAGRCAVVRHVGSDDSIAAPVIYLYSEWLEESCSSIRDFPLFFQRVTFFPEVSENEMITDIYLPIE